MSFACSSTDAPRRPLPEDPTRLLTAARARRGGGEGRGDN